jgi:hypothetical protein
MHVFVVFYFRKINNIFLFLKEKRIDCMGPCRIQKGSGGTKLPMFHWNRYTHDGCKTGAVAVSSLQKRTYDRH